MKYPYPCPKCGATHTWVETEDECIVQRCICGLNRYLYFVSKDGQTTVMRAALSGGQVTLPPKDTKIYKCLLAFLAVFPQTLTTGEVALRSSLSGKETASLMFTLMTRGLIVRVEERRGLAGGSSWKMSAATEKLMDAQKHFERRQADVE